MEQKNTSIAYTLGINDGTTTFIRSFNLSKRFGEISEEMRYVANNTSYDLSRVVVAERVIYDGKQFERQPIDVSQLIRAFQDKSKSKEIVSYSKAQDC